MAMCASRCFLFGWGSTSGLLRKAKRLLQRLERIVKTLHLLVNPPRENSSHKIGVKYFHNTHLVSSDPHTIRRNNALVLFRLFVEERIASGEQPKGLESAFAERVGISVSTWSMAKSGARPIGDKLARQIEHRCDVPRGWLDQARDPEGTSPGEEQFLELALQVYRNTNAAGRKRLRQLLKSWTEEPRQP
jgi:transcriptional regulator with XRE-family HTH domain